MSLSTPVLSYKELMLKIGIESDLTYVGLNSAHVGVLEVEQTYPYRPLHL